MSYPEIAMELTKEFFNSSKASVDYYKIDDDKDDVDTFNRVYNHILDNLCEQAKKHRKDNDLKSGFKAWQ